MKILAIMGSPRKGDGYKVIRLVEEKMKSLGQVEFEYLFLKDFHLGFCKGCGVCFTTGEEFCPHKDDREKIARLMEAADGVIFVSPAYVINVTALMKNFIDRFAYMCHRPRFFEKYAMLVSNGAAFGMSQTLKALGWAARTWGFNVVDELGVVSFPFSSAAKRRKTEQRIERSSTMFYRAIERRVKHSPSIIGLVYFQGQRGYFGDGDKQGADFKYWEQRGWLRDNCRYYVPVRVNFLKRLAASLIFQILKRAGR